MNNLKAFFVKTECKQKHVATWIKKDRSTVALMKERGDNINSETMCDILINYIEYAKKKIKFCEKELAIMRKQKEAKK